MRGIPWLRLGFVAVFLALLAIPVWRITGHVDSQKNLPSAPHPDPTSVSPTTLRIESTAPWSSLSLSLLGRNIPFTSLPDGASATATLNLPDSGADLVISAAWPDETKNHALRIRAKNERTHRDILDHTLWGQARILDAVTLPSSP